VMVTEVAALPAAATCATSGMDSDPLPPAMVMVLAAPVPDAITPAPTKSSDVASVASGVPSSLTVSDPLPPPVEEMVRVFDDTEKTTLEPDAKLTSGHSRSLLPFEVMRATFSAQYVPELEPVAVSTWPVVPPVGTPPAEPREPALRSGLGGPSRVTFIHSHPKATSTLPQPPVAKPEVSAVADIVYDPLADAMMR
jgi:hypothetical protein